LCTFAVGHLALGYISGKATSKLLNVNVNIPLLFVVSVICDIDLIIPGLQHRGLTHSLIFLSLLSLPAFVFCGKKATAYFVALILHPLLGDYLAGGGVQLLWPVSLEWYGIGIGITSLTAILMEWTFFIVSLTVMFKTKDAWTLFQQHPSNLLLSIPIVTVLLPTLLSFPLHVPLELIIPHLIYLTLFALSILIDFKAILMKT
jgi:membrane-bound metal-dependent hydrolase YbcI (DUF457 family)